MAFRRVAEDGTDARLVLVNLSDAPQTYALSGETVVENIGEYTIEGGTVTLAPYAGLILK